MEFSAEMKYVLDTIWLLISGSLVMWMAAGFAMLEAGMVRTKSVTAILTKNISLYALACIAYFAVGYNFMYGAGNDFLGSGLFVFAASLVVWGVLKATVGIRISEEEERSGVDECEFGMHSYPEFVKMPPGYESSASRI